MSHPLTGPVYVKGAEPADLLEVELFAYETSGFGWTAFWPAIAYSMSLIPARKSPSPKKPWSTATSKHFPPAAKSRFRRAYTKTYSSPASSSVSWRPRTPSTAPIAVVASAPAAFASRTERSNGQPASLP